MFWKFAISALILPTCLGWGAAQATTTIPEQTSQQISLTAATSTASDTNLATESLDPGQLIAENYYRGCGYRRSRSRYYRRSGYYNGRSRSYYNNGYNNNRYYRSNYNRGNNRYYRNNYQHNGGHNRYHRSNYHHY